MGSPNQRAESECEYSINYMDESNHVSDYQRLTKPLIEKRRRARINLSLTQLKQMVIDSGRHHIVNPKCKYEKADILELTVKYLQDIHKSQQTERIKSDQSFTAGFSECVKQVELFLKYLPLTSDCQEGDTITKKLMSHLENIHHLNSNNAHNSFSLGECIDNNDENSDSNLNSLAKRSAESPQYFGVIHHTSEYSGSPSSSRTTPLSSPRTHSPAMSPSPQSMSMSCSPFSSEIEVRPIDLVLYGNERNGQCYQVMDIDGVWRPW